MTASRQESDRSFDLLHPWPVLRSALKVLPMSPVQCVTHVSGPDLKNMVARDGIEPPSTIEIV